MRGFRGVWVAVLVVFLAVCVGWVFWQSLPSNEQMGLPPLGTPATPENMSGPGTVVVVPE